MDQSDGGHPVWREPLKVYWQPGCTGCLRMKEFLTNHGVEFISINVLADKEGCDELVQLAGRRVPIARRGNDWVDGQVLADLARIAGISLDPREMLSPHDLARRVDVILGATQRYCAQIPEASLDQFLPSRPRRYRELIAHIAQIIEAFLDLVECAKRLEVAAYDQNVPAGITSGPQLTGFVAAIQERFDRWWLRHGMHADFSLQADVYYGRQTLHEFLERSTWHACQHTRQLQLVLESLGIAPNGRLIAEDLAGLPLPSHVWDNELAFAVPGKEAAIA
ncbi:MAG: glutaredoxin domain-containing protein [Casimicrobiaceae bacterium]